MILSENEIQTPADRMIWTEFLITSVSISEIHLKDRKRTDCRGRIRGAIAPDNAITSRVQPLYEACEVYVGTPQGIEIASANDFCQFGGPSPSPASVFPQIS